MPLLKNYHHFAGRHSETGTLHNYYAYRGVTAPHTNQPYSEALFMGIAGGVVMGYFSFAYAGCDPHVALLTRNTFDPLNTMLSRLGVVQELRQTSSAAKGVANLLDTLDAGVPAIVWADMWSLPYNALADDEGMWGMAPLIVYGYDETTNEVPLADRANVGLTITTAQLAAARARVKKEKFRVLTLDPPDAEKLTAAVTAGIWDCINLFTEKPPKGSANNWGLKAYQQWADLLTKPKQRLSWAKVFPPGRKLYAGLTSALSHYGATGIRQDAERALYADFLAEAALILEKEQLNDVARHFRQSSAAWQQLATILLPDSVALLGESRALMQQKEALFTEQGAAALPVIQQIHERLDEIRAVMEHDFPLAADEVTTLQTAIAEQLLTIRELEETAILALRAAMAD